MKTSSKILIGIGIVLVIFAIIFVLAYKDLVEFYNVVFVNHAPASVYNNYVDKKWGDNSIVKCEVNETGVTIYEVVGSDVVINEEDDFNASGSLICTINENADVITKEGPECLNLSTCVVIADRKGS